MANEIMTIRLTLDGFSYAECPTSASILLDDAPFHEVAPGPDFQSRLRESLLAEVAKSDAVRDVCCQFVSTRVLVLPPHVTEVTQATAFYALTFGQTEAEEQVILQPLTLPSGQAITLCFGINRELYHFMLRNFDDVTFEHHLSTLITQGAQMASGNCLVTRCDTQILELALFRGGKLDLVNVYRTSQADNRSYYLMNTWQQQRLDQLHDNLLVLGQNTEALQVRANMHRFIKHVFG